MNTRDPFGLRGTAGRALPFLQQGITVAARSANQFRDQVSEEFNKNFASTHSLSSNKKDDDAGHSPPSHDNEGYADRSPQTLQRHDGKKPFARQNFSPHLLTPESAASGGDHEEGRGTAYGGRGSTYRAGVAETDMASQNSSVHQQSWQPRRHANSWAGYGQKVMDSISSKEDGALPMYKDKPFAYYPASGRKTPVWRRNRPILVVLLLIGAAIYWFELFSATPPADLSNTHSTSDSRSKKAKGSGILGGLRKSSKGDINWNARRDAVRDAFKLSWDAYERHAWGYDEFHPVAKDGRQMVPNGMGWTIVDALDTMIIMNLSTQLTHAREWISTTLNYDQDHDVSTFETTIRMLGGLLSAHYLSNEHPDWAPIQDLAGTGGEDLYLEKATDLADRLLGAYNSPSGVPYASVNLATRKGIPSHDDGGASSTAEATSVQLEMKYLAKLTGEKNYWDAAEKVMKVVDDQAMPDGLVPIYIYADTGFFRGDNIRFGSRGDSYYEYLIKQYLQTSLSEPVYKEMWDETVMGVKKHLITYTKHSNLTILAEKPQGLNNAVFPKMDHLVCFYPGTLALSLTGGRTLAEARADPTWGPADDENMELARQLTKTCWGMYKVTATGLSPEIAHFRIHDPPLMYPVDGRGKLLFKLPSSPELDDEGSKSAWHMDYEIHANDYHNLQRPETVESLFYMWRVTREERYRHWAWEMFESFALHTAVDGGGGFSSINHVDKVPPPMRDNMESFWLAETLKYFYLIFDDGDDGGEGEEKLDLRRVVFNTEAHPLPRFELGKLFSTGWKRRLRRDEYGNPVAQ